MTELSDCCGAGIEWSGFVGKGNQNACSKCHKPCKVITPQEKVDSSVDSERLLTDEIKQLIEHEANYYAHEIVVPITGNPTTPYEINAVKKYKAEFTLFADKIIPLAFAAGEAKSQQELTAAIKELGVWSRKCGELEAQKEKDRQLATEAINEIRKIDREIATQALAEAEKKGAREQLKEALDILGTRQYADAYDFLQSKLKELE